MATRSTCEDGCLREDVFVEVRSNWELLCDDCARERGVLYRPARKG